MALLLALDFGGTKNSAALFEVGQAQNLVQRRVLRRASVANPNAAYDVATMLDLARELLQGQRPERVGVSFGGPVQYSQGMVVRSHHVTGWEQFPLCERLRNEFGAPVVMDNDANAAALGEARYGAGAARDAGGKSVQSLLYLTVSTGVGGGWVLDGEVYRGANELAGEIGHMAIDPAGPECVCGRRGCVEALASGTAIARAARERLANEPTAGQRLRALIGNEMDKITAERVNQAALEGDALARNVMDAAAQALGWGIGNAIVLMNPALVILGGGVSRAGERYLETVRTAARANVMPELRDTFEILPAALGDDAPLWGAAALALNREFSP